MHATHTLSPLPCSQEADENGSDGLDIEEFRAAFGQILGKGKDDQKVLRAASTAVSCREHMSGLQLAWPTAVWLYNCHTECMLTCASVSPAVFCRWTSCS